MTDEKTIKEFRQMIFGSDMDHIDLNKEDWWRLSYTCLRYIQTLEERIVSLERELDEILDIDSEFIGETITEDIAI